MPQSHSSPASSRRFPQGGATVMVFKELGGLDKQLGWARTMKSASCSTLQSLKNSGNARFPVLRGGSRRCWPGSSVRTSIYLTHICPSSAASTPGFVLTWVYPPSHSWNCCMTGCTCIPVHHETAQSCVPSRERWWRRDRWGCHGDPMKTQVLP